MHTYVCADQEQLCIYQYRKCNLHSCSYLERSTYWKIFSSTLNTVMIIDFVNKNSEAKTGNLRLI